MKASEKRSGVTTMMDRLNKGLAEEIRSSPKYLQKAEESNGVITGMDLRRTLR